MNWFRNMISDENGQGMVEYGLLIGLIAIFIIVAIIFLRNSIINIFTKAGNALETAGG